MEPWILNVSDIRFGLKETTVPSATILHRTKNEDLPVSLFIAFDEAGIFEREPLLPAIKGISDFVSKTVAGFDSLFV